MAGSVIGELLGSEGLALQQRALCVPCTHIRVSDSGGADVQTDLLRSYPYCL